jgi:hypothetical protein
MELMLEKVKMLAMEIAAAKVEWLISYHWDFAKDEDTKFALELAILNHKEKNLIQSILIDRRYMKLFFDTEFSYSCLLIRNLEFKDDIEATNP